MPRSLDGPASPLFRPVSFRGNAAMDKLAAVQKLTKLKG